MVYSVSGLHNIDVVYLIWLRWIGQFYHLKMNHTSQESSVISVVIKAENNKNEQYIKTTKSTPTLEREYT